MKRLLITIFLLSVIPSFGCRCITNTVNQELVNFSDIIVKGRVMSIEYVDRVDTETGEESRLMKVKFLVNSIYKGSELSEIIEVYTDENDETCGVNFQEGRSYILLGYYSEHIGTINGENMFDVLFTSRCMLTQLYSKDVEDRVKELIESR